MEKKLFLSVVFENRYLSNQISAWQREAHNNHKCKDYCKFNNISLSWCSQYGNLSLFKCILGDESKVMNLLHGNWVKYVMLILSRQTKQQLHIKYNGTSYFNEGNSNYFSSNHSYGYYYQYNKSSYNSESKYDLNYNSRNHRLDLQQRLKEDLDLFEFVFKLYIKDKQQQIDNNQNNNISTIQESKKDLVVVEEEEDSLFGGLSSMMENDDNKTDEEEKHIAQMLLLLVECENGDIARILLNHIQVNSKCIEDFEKKAYHQYFPNNNITHQFYGQPKSIYYNDKYFIINNNFDNSNQNNTNNHVITQIIDNIEKHIPDYQYPIDGFFIPYSVWIDDKELFIKLLNGRELDCDNVFWLLKYFSHGHLYHYLYDMLKENDYFKRVPYIVDCWNRMLKRMLDIGDIDSVKDLDAKVKMLKPIDNDNIIKNANMDLVKYLVDNNLLTLNNSRYSITWKYRLDIILYIFLKVQVFNQDDICRVVNENIDNIINLVKSIDVDKVNDYFELFGYYDQRKLLKAMINDNDIRLTNSSLEGLMVRGMDDLVIEFSEKRALTNRIMYDRRMDPCFFRIWDRFNGDLLSIPRLFKIMTSGHYYYLDSNYTEEDIDKNFLKTIINRLKESTVVTNLHYEMLKLYPEEMSARTNYYGNPTKAYLEFLMDNIELSNMPMEILYQTIIEKGYVDLLRRLIIKNPQINFPTFSWIDYYVMSFDMFILLIDTGYNISRITSVAKKNTHLRTEEIYKYAITSVKKPLPFTTSQVSHLVWDLIHLHSPGFYEEQVTGIIKYIESNYPDFDYTIVPALVETKFPFNQGIDVLFSSACIKGWNQFAIDIFKKVYLKNISKQNVRELIVKAILSSLEGGNVKLPQSIIPLLDTISNQELMDQLKLKLPTYYQNDTLCNGHLECWNYITNTLNINVQ